MSLPVISNEFPADLSTNNGLRPQFSFQLQSLNGIDPTSVQVFVNGVLAYDGSAGGLQPGFVPTVDWASPGGFTFFGQFLFASFNQVAYLPFATNNIPVRVIASDVGDLNTLDTTWHFDTDSGVHNPVIQNTSNDISPAPNVCTGFDPARFDLTVDPINNITIDPTTLHVTMGIGHNVVVAGVAQAGWTLLTVAILGGFRYELFPTGAFPFWSPASTPTFQIFVQSTIDPVSMLRRSINTGISFTSNPAATSNPPNLTFIQPDWNTLQPGSGVGGIICALMFAQYDLAQPGPMPILDTYVVSKNGGPNISIYDATMGGFQAPWTGSLHYPTPPGSNVIGTNVFTTPPVGFSTTGDVLVFDETHHIVSAATGQRYDYNGDYGTFYAGAFTWNIQAPPPPPIFGKKYAVEAHDPRTLIVRTSLDGNPTDCDFNLAIAKIRNAGDQ